MLSILVQFVQNPNQGNALSASEFSNALLSRIVYDVEGPSCRVYHWSIFSHSDRLCVGHAAGGHELGNAFRLQPAAPRWGQGIALESGRLSVCLTVNL